MTSDCIAILLKTTVTQMRSCKKAIIPGRLDIPIHQIFALRKIKRTDMFFVCKKDSENHKNFFPPSPATYNEPTFISISQHIGFKI